MAERAASSNAPAYIYLLYGEDEFSRSEQVAALRDKMRQLAAGEFNLSELDGSSVSLDELLATCEAVPFLAGRRMVIVHGLLARWTRGPASRGRGRKREAAGAGDERSRFLDRLPSLPPTTSLVLVEGGLSDETVAQVQAPRLIVRRFDPPRGERLVRWLRQRAEQHGAVLEDEAARALAAITEDLRRLDGELAKLALACEGPIDAAAVRSLVASAETSIFALLDAVAEGRSGPALAALRSLYQQGQRPEAIVAQLASLARRLLVVRELSRQGTFSTSQAAAHGLNPNALPKLQRQAKLVTSAQLVRALERLLEADRAVKTGQMDQELAIELAVAELAERPAATFG